jgi:hypothetical protein
MLRCRSCGREYTVEEVLEQVDEDLEQRLGFVPADRF